MSLWTDAPVCRVAVAPLRHLLLVCVCLGLPVGQASAGPAIDPEVLPEQGSQRAEITVDTFGRYRISAESPRGVRIQLVDRMGGAGPAHGQPGVADGRLDVFLDRGTYRLELQAPKEAPAASGEVRLSVQRAMEQHEAPLQLRPQTPVESALRDDQRRSWWLEITEDQTVAVEAVGRHLDDLRLWQAGSWLVEARPRCAIIEPVGGRPMKRCALVHPLSKGLYRVSAYGGAGAPWSTAGEEAPLYVRWGVPHLLGEAGRQIRTIGPHGLDRFRLSDGVHTVSVALGDPVARGRAVKLESAPYSDAAPYASGGVSAEITHESRVPEARVRVASVVSHVFTVTGPPGTPYTLGWFPGDRGHRVLRGKGDYYLTTVYDGALSDRPDATALLVREHDGAKLVADLQGVPLKPGRVYRRQLNLSGEISMYLDVTEGGRYAFDVPEAQVRVLPLAEQVPEGFRAPEFTTGRLEQALAAGVYRLFVRPRAQGGVEAVTLTIGPASWLGDVLARGAGEAATVPPTLQRGRISLDPKRPLWLHHGEMGGAAMGVVLRQLPADPATPIPLTLASGEAVEIELEISTRGRVRALDIHGLPLQVSLDGGPWRDAHEVRPGRLVARVRNTGDAVAMATLQLAPARAPKATPVPRAKMKALPSFPTLTAARPAFAHLDAQGHQTWKVKVESPALYQIESTGLLHTHGHLRARTRLGLAKASANGAGRNFRVARYLDEGDYQITVTAQGESLGRVGVRLVPTPLVDGGALELGVPARETLPAGRAVAYWITIAEGGRYRLRSLGRGHTFNCRLEDEAGWPVGRPETRCDMSREFAPGRYRVIVLPRAVESQRMTLIEATPKSVERTGHGPHPLPAYRDVSHVWREPAGARPRAPDLWRFEQDAGGAVDVHLSEGMVADVQRRDGDDWITVHEQVHGVQSDLALKAGSHRLAIRGLRKSDHLPYSVQIIPSRLMAGHRRQVYIGRPVEVGVGREGLYRLTSTGALDVQARLLDADGASVAANDDRPDGWNFRIVKRLTPGVYRLKVDALERSYGEVEVQMERLEGVDEPPLQWGEARAVALGSVNHHLPLPSVDGGAVIVTARSKQNVGVAVEARVAGRWVQIAEGAGGSVLLPVRPTPGGRHRVRAWSVDRRDIPVEITAHAPRRGEVDERLAARGRQVDGGRGAPWGSLAVSVRGPGVFAVGGPREGWVCATAGAGCAPFEGRSVVVGAEGLVLVGARGVMKAARLPLADEQIALAVPAGATAHLDLPAGEGPLWVEARAAIGRPWVKAPGATVAVAPDGAATVHIGGSVEGAAQALLRAGDGGALEARVTATRLSPAPRARRAVGILSEAVAARGVTALSPAARAPSRLALSAGMAALVDGALYWAADGPAELALPPARQVQILNPTAEAGRYRLTVGVAEPAGPSEITLARPLELSPTRAGLRRVVVPPTPGARLRLAGAVAQATWVDAQGRVAPAESASVGAGGVLWLEHRAGPLMTWLQMPGAQGPWGAPSKKVITLEAGGVIPLQGAAVGLKLDVGRPVMAHVRLPGPHLVRATARGAAEQVALRPGGGGVDLWLPEGEAGITLRGVAGATLWGAAEITLSEPQALGEGVGPEVLLSPGAGVPFALTVTRSGPLGVGVRAEAERVEATLLDARGVAVAAGPLQMPTLAPGQYVLVLKLAADAAPVRARPVIAGIEPPSDLPPEEVIRKYLRLAEPPGAL